MMNWISGGSGAFHLWCDEDDPVDLLGVALESLDYLAHFQVPNYHLSVLSSTRDKSVALADTDINDEISVAMQTGLQSH